VEQWLSKTFKEKILEDKVVVLSGSTSELNFGIVKALSSADLTCL